MTGPYFESWEHDNLVKFAKEAYEKLQKQEEELQRLRLLLADEREACAAVCERIATDNYGELSGRTIPEACARAIRARGQQ
jgi:hypothetical protein